VILVLTKKDKSLLINGDEKKNKNKKRKRKDSLDLVCSNCQSNESSNKFLICTLCSKSFHIYCLIPKLKKVPQDVEWHCKECSNQPFPFYTCWIAMCDAKIDDGVLAVTVGSHDDLGGYDRPMPPAPGKPLLPADYKKKKKELKWQTTNVQSGDIILFNFKTIHAATANLSQTYRVSLDTRVFYKASLLLPASSSA